MEPPAPAATDALLGRLLDGRYRLDRPLARGGMATVYLGTDTRLDRVVAVKVMRAHLAEDPEFVERFAREARAAARLSTPEVVAVHDQGTDAATGTAYLVMEYVAGRTLRDLIRDGGPLPPARALALLEPVLVALAAAHGAGLVHRDVKPENVLLGDDGRVKVADFGLARAIETSALTATSGVLIGTVAYLAPEQVEHGTADPRTDVYAAGILLWEMLTGAPPYGGATPLSVAYRHVNDDVPAPSTVVDGVPPAVDALVVRATRRDAAARPVDAGAFLAELRAVRAAQPGDGLAAGGHPTQVIPRPATPPGPPTVPPSTGPAPTPRSGRRRRGPVAAVVVAVLAALALGGGWYLGSGRYTQAPPVLGLTRAAAQAKLSAAGLRTTVAPQGQFSETVAAGLVLRQDPGPGGRVRRDGRVTLVLSRGPDRRAVPDLVGATEAAATARLTGAGLRPGPVTREYSEAPVGTVIRTSPAAGQRLRPGSAVALVLSRGVEQLPVPDVRGRPRDEAEQVVTEAGFVAKVTEVFSEDVPKGRVADQSPSSGTAGRGSTITLAVSKGPPLVTVPDVRGMRRDDAERALRAVGLKSRVIRFPGANTVRTQSPGGGARVPKGSTVTLGVF